MDIKELPVKVSTIIRQLKISLYKYNDNADYIHSIGLDEVMKTTDGFTLLISGQYKIFYDSSMNANRIRFTLAHELGHIICKHKFQLMKGSYITTRNTDPSNNDPIIETEANMFAARLLAPACVLHELKLFTPEDIAETCAISHQAAELRCKRLMFLEERNKRFIKDRGYGCYYLSPLEKQVKEQFSDYINNHS